MLRSLIRCRRDGVLLFGGCHAQRAGAGRGCGQIAAAAKKAPADAGKHTAGKRTPWGDPHLQGTWDYRDYHPAQRPHNMGDRQILTDAEAATLEARAAKRLDEPPDGSVPANTIHAPYWTDPGRRAPDDKRTSLIIYSAGRPPAAADAGRPVPARDGRTRRHGRARGRQGGRPRRSQHAGALHHAGPAGVESADALQQQHRHLRSRPATSRRPRDGPRDAHRAARRTARALPRHPPVGWATRAATGTATRSSSRRRISSTRRAIAGRAGD